MDAAKAIAMGAELVGMAAPFIKLYSGAGEGALADYLQQWVYRLKAVFLMTASVNIRSLQQKPVLIKGQTRAWLEARHIDWRCWSR